MIANCPYPGCPTQVQRTQHGNLQDGLAAHYKTVHPEAPPPALHPDLITEETTG